MGVHGPRTWDQFEGEGQPHARERWFRNKLWWAEIEEFLSWHVPNFEELGFQVGPSFFPFWFKLFASDSNQNWRFGALQNRRLGSGWEDGCLCPIKEGPTLKPSSSKWGTCQGQDSFTLAYQIMFWNWRFGTCVACTKSNLRQIESMNRTSLGPHLPKHELSFELHFLVWTTRVSLQNDAKCKGHLTLPLLGFGPSSKGLQFNSHRSTNKICPFCWTSPPWTPISSAP